MTVERAEELKERRGLSDSGAEYELGRIVSSSLDILVNAVRKIKEEYTRRYEATLGTFSLIGGTSRLAGIREYIGKEAGMQYRDFNIFSRVAYPKELAPLVGDIEPQLSIALAAGLISATSPVSKFRIETV